MIPILTFVLILLAILLVVPFHLQVRGRYEGGFEGFLALTWLWGLLGLDYHKEELRILLGGKIIFRKIRKDGPGRKRAEAPVAKKGKTKTWIFFHMPFLFEQSKRLYRSLSPKGSLRGAVGLGDPAETGMFMGVVAGFFSWLPLPFLTIVPDFEEERFRFEGHLSVRILLISISVLSVKFLLSREGRGIIRNL